MRAISSSAICFRLVIFSTTGAGASTGRPRCRAWPSYRQVPSRRREVLAQTRDLRADVDRAEVSSSTVTVARLRRTSIEADASNPSSGGVSRASACTAGTWASRSAESILTRRAATFCDGLSPWSLRNRRISVVSFCRSSIRREESASAATPDAAGHSAITRDSPPVNTFHKVSVTNGITGCSRRSSASRTVPRTVLVPSTYALPSASCTFASSRYQSHTSSHAKW